MPELVPARVYFAILLGNGDYATGAAILDTKLSEARRAWSKFDTRKSVAGLYVVAATAALAIGIMLLLAGAGQIVLVGVLPVLVVLYFTVMQFVAMESYVRFGRAPRRLEYLMPRFVDRWLAERYAIPGINAGSVFEGLRTRVLVARVGTSELDPELFADKLWPLLFSSYADERSRSAFHEFGYRGEEILILAPQSGDVTEVPGPEVPVTAPVPQHIIQLIPSDMKAAWIAEAVKRKGYAHGSHRHALLVAVLDALWDELHASDWHNRKINNAEVARRCHDRVVCSGQGFHSTELTEGKPSKVPADWIHKIIAGRASDYRFVVEAAQTIVSAHGSSD